MENTEKINEEKDMSEVIDEKDKVQFYKNILERNPQYNYEIQDFIKEIENKYKYKPEVSNYFGPSNPNNRTNNGMNQLGFLYTIDSMLDQYIAVKAMEEIRKKISGK